MTPPPWQLRRRVDRLHDPLHAVARAVLRKRAERLKWSARRRSGSFGGMAAEYDALYGRARKRPRMPDDLLALIRRGQLAAAVAAYRERFPKFADRAEQAINDARAFFAPPAASVSAPPFGERAMCAPPLGRSSAHELGRRRS